MTKYITHLYKNGVPYYFKGGSSKYRYLTYTLDQTQSNPANMITAVSDDAKSMIYSDVMSFIGAYPVLLDASGNEYEKRLNPNNFQQFEDGSDASSFTASANYDVMIAFPRRGFKVNTSQKGESANTMQFSITDNPNDPDFEYYAWQRLSSGTLGSSTAKYYDKDVFYLGAYPSVENSSKMRSRYNQTPTVSQTISSFRGKCTSKGTGWAQYSYLQLRALQFYFLALYKNTNAQSVLGRGYVDASGNSYPGPKTGVNTYNQGMNYGTSSGTVPVKFLGLEHWYGGLWNWIDGLASNSDSDGAVNMPNATGSNIQDDGHGTGYFSIGTRSLTDGAYISKMQLGELSTFVPTSNSGGSDSTYYADYARWLSGARVAIFGGEWNNASWCGAFCWLLIHAASSSLTTVGSRLMFL